MIDPKLLFFSLALALTASSCGKSTVVRGDQYSGEDFINIELDKNAKPISQEQGLNRHSGGSSAKKHKDPKNIVRSPFSGEWTIIDAGDFHIAQDSDMPYIIFSDSDDRFYASNGCNILNGDYSVADKQITFSNVISTMMLCADIGYESEINKVICDGVTVKTSFEKIGNETFLTFYTNSGNFLMRLRNHNLDVLNGYWEVDEIEGEEVEGSEVNVFIDIPQRSIHGNTGCNYFNGVVTFDPEMPSSISFSQMGVTMRACPNHEIERSMLVGLEETASYSLKDSSRTLLLKNEAGKVVIKLVREN